jgi:hypothetical protein
MEAFWARIDRDAEGAKDSQSAQASLLDYVKGLDSDGRREAETIVIDWLRSPNGRQRFDALHVVYELRLTSAVPVLRELADASEDRADPAGPDDWAQYNRAIGFLTGETS